MVAIENYTQSSPVVSTTHGKVRGQLRHTIYDAPYYCFDGIPYAEPPVGALRFKAPQELAAWQGIRNCTEPPALCMQLNNKGSIEGSEDCLYVNVYAKKLHSPRPLPVIAYIHGGIFKLGDHTRRKWSPDYLMEEDIIFISIGHRIGAYGWLSFDDPTLEVPGNAGLKDVLLALKWIKANCAYFNGDADNITLWGHSSGSMTAHLLMITPQTEGLFHKVILMAGYKLEYDKIENVEYRFAQQLGYQGPNEDRAVFEYIKSVEPSKLATPDFLTENEKFSNLTMVFIPRVEPYWTESGLILEEPIILQRQAWSNHLPLLMGSTSNEGLGLYYKYFKCNEHYYEVYRQQPEVLLPRTLQTRSDELEQRKWGQQLIELHLGKLELSSKNFRNLIELSNYNFVYHTQHRVVEARRAYSNAPTYLYRFDFDSVDGNLYRVRGCGIGEHGACHTDDLCYIFFIPDMSFKLDKRGIEYAMTRRMISMWCAFAAKSDPNTELIKPVVWQPLNKTGPYKCLNIADDIDMRDAPEQRKCHAIDQMYKNAGINLI